MRDPFFAQLMFQIEQRICAADQNAKEQGLLLKDSQVQSALTKARGLATGKDPKIEDSTNVERILKTLVLDLHSAPRDIMTKLVDEEGVEHEQPLPMTHWAAAIETVLDSIKTHRSQVPGSRDYLDYVQNFVAQAGKSQSPR